GLLRIDHVGVAVADLDEAISFYAHHFGLRCVHREENEEQGTREAMLAVDGDTSGTRIQLLAPMSPDSPIARFL
ncbi:methylmalonyl-CoA epimerase, partial [Streptomyces sp. SID11233]|nr:methylmalonyl-CoA epimerase [Streptomyces sp. SID11233]